MEVWPFSFRFSLEAIQSNSNDALQVWIGIAIFVIAGVSYLQGKKLAWTKPKLIAISLGFLILSLAIALPPLTIKAYPDTYRKSPAPYDVMSIANGANHYKEHCVKCHGYQGKGNGILSRTLTTTLPDLLTEAHISEHLPGDFYHWVTNGMVDTDMPGFSEELPERDRWDLVNFIYALANGYQARILSPKVVPNKPYVEPPGFPFTGLDGAKRHLYDLQEKKNVLLVIGKLPRLEVRLDQLALTAGKFQEAGLIVIVVPIGNVVEEEIKQLASRLPFPVVTQYHKEIVESYALFRRTISYPDILGRGTSLEHIEFLIDRYGFLRARWLPSMDSEGWRDTENLLLQVAQLNQEKRIAPSPDGYIP